MRRGDLLLSAIVVGALLGFNFIWYSFGWHRDHPWLQPIFMAAFELAFLFLWTRTRGRSWSSISRQGRIVIVTALLLFSILWLFGRTRFYDQHLKGLLPDGAFSPLYGFIYMSLSCLLLRTVLPLLVIRTVIRKKPADFGYRLSGTFARWWVYLVLFIGVVLVVVFYASALPAFLRKYPMCKGAIQDGTITWTHLLVYQLFYGIVFVSGESFWRGYIIFGLEEDMGWFALIFMIIPYTMAHYGKPFPETMGAVAAGLVLGYLALKHRNFWLGVAAHWGIAITMDVSAIVRRGIDVGF